MPERSFRILIHSNSSYLTLHQSFNHLCGGVYTSGWLPSVTVAPGTVEGVQAESDGLATGTEGYVKYDVAGQDRKHGMIYIYWDNPFFGATKFRFATNALDVLPDCDYSAPSGGSSFSDQQSLDFTLNFLSYAHGTGESGTINQPGDLVVFGTGSGGVLGELLGTLGVDPNPVLELELTDAVRAMPVSTPGLFGQSSPPLTHTILVDATLDDWVGAWHDGSVTVAIELQAAQLPEESTLTAAVSDASANPRLEFTEVFVPGPVGLLTAHADTIATLVAGQAQDQEQRFSRLRG